jgi:hypothetical protein
LFQRAAGRWEDGWLAHVNEPDARETAIRGLIGSAD